MKKRLRGTFAVIPTPFKMDGSLDLDGLRQNIDWLIDEGIHGIIAAGSTGEFLCLTMEERKLVVEKTIEYAEGRVPVVIGTAAEWTREAIYWTRHAQDAGCDGAMIVAPYYSKPNKDELYAHFKAISEATNIPIMVYNNPDTTGINMSPEFLARLSELDNVDHVKDTTFDARRIRDIQRCSAGRLTVFAGIMAFESFVMGAEGWVSVPANIAPRLCSRMFDLCAEGKIEEAKKVYERLTPLMHLLESGDYVQVPKYALDLMGKAGGTPRLPRLPLTQQKRVILKKILSDLDLICE